MNQINRSHNWQKKLDLELNKIVKSLKRNYKPEKIILFGSAAHGNTGPDSDLDILIVKKGIDELPRYKRSMAILKLIDSDMPIDFLVYTPYELKKRLYLEDPFIQQIIEEGKVLYGA